MATVFRLVACMGTQFQTMYIRASSAGAAIREATKRGAVSVASISECDTQRPFDFVA